MFHRTKVKLIKNQDDGKPRTNQVINDWKNKPFISVLNNQVGREEA